MENYETKKRYKMYKAGKNWVVAPLVFLGLAMGVSFHNPKVMADTNVQTQTDSNNDNQTNKQEVTLQATQNTESKTVVNQENSSQQASVENNQSVETKANEVADTTQQTSANQEVKQSTPVTVQAQSAPVQQATPANNNVTTQVAENKVATAPATPATTSEQNQNTQVVNNSEQASSTSSTTQKSEEPKVETPVNTADNASQKKVNDNWYLVDNNTGKNLTGFQEIKDQNKVVYYAPSNAQMQYGWQNINNNKYYFDTFNGAMTTGQRNIDGSWYLFDNQGVMQTGFQRIESQNKTVHYDSNGKMQYGWQWIDNATRYFDTFNGAMATGQDKINNHWYLFDNKGAMQRGFQNLKAYGEDKTVYYNKDGKMQYGWQWIDNATRYFDTFNGAMATGQNKINNHWYLFDNEGAMQRGFQNLKAYGEDKVVYYNQDGWMLYGQQRINGNWYNFDKVTGKMSVGFTNIPDQNKTVYYSVDKAKLGQMQYGWQNISNNSYYFDKVTGAVQKGQKNIDGNWYLFDKNNGSMKKGFQNLASYGQNKTVYYADNGQMQYGIQTINGNRYYFDKVTGSMAKGLLYNKDSKTLQYFTNDGKQVVGKFVIAGKSYNFDPKTGNLLASGEIDVDGNKYLLKDNKVQVGFQSVNGKVYYYNTDNGQKQFGQKNINNHWYLFDKDSGVMKTGFQDLAPYGKNKTVYYAPNGQMQYGQQKIDNQWYLFDKVTGAIKTGFQNLSSYGQNKTVYYASNGQMQYGQQNINGRWYLFDKVTGAMQTGFRNLSAYGQNKTVYYASNGQMQYGWQKINNKKYYFDTFNGAMKTGTVNINGKNYTFNSDGTLKQDTWGWPFPSVGQGSFTGAQLFGVNPGGEFRMNGFHDGLDFGSYDHPGSSVHAVHSGVVTQIGYIAGLENYVVVQSDEYSFVYQEAFSNRGNIKVRVGQQINTGDVIGYRDTSHLHLGITREKNIMRAIANSFNNNGTWLNPLELIRNGIANQ